MSRPEPPRRGDYAAFRDITTRWMDNDVYGHVNNVVYYSFFDTVVNGWLVDQGLLEIETSPVIGLVVETNCSYFAPVMFPEPVVGGLKVLRLGTSSVTYGVGVFAGESDRAAAAGRFTHVYVGRESRRPVPLGGEMRSGLGLILREA